MSTSFKRCVLSRRCLCVGLITSPEESYRMQCVCDREASIKRRPWPTGVCRFMNKTNVVKELIRLAMELNTGK